MVVVDVLRRRRLFGNINFLRRNLRLQPFRITPLLLLMLLLMKLIHLGDLYAESGQTLPGSFSAAAAAVDRTRSRLYRSQILQVNMRSKARAEIYTAHSFAQLCNLNF